MNKNDIVMISDSMELGYFTCGCFRIAFDAIDNMFVFEYRLTPLDDVFINGEQITELFVKSSNLTVVQAV